MRDGLIVDNFAGGGGASTGIYLATGRHPDLAVNHNAEALAIHAANHPTTQHLCEDVWDVDPVVACGGQPVEIAWFSPDCTFFSKARGAKPFRDRKKATRRRALAHVVVRWAAAVRPRIIAMENVEEFEDWGPLNADGLPDKDRAGLSFRRWRRQLENLGYRVELRQLRACDFGAPTIRKRLFVVARCDGLPIVWPSSTHGPGRAQPFRTAAECIDWSIPVPSIFGRRRPLADATLRRIARGIQKFVIGSTRPFVVPLRGTSRAHTSVHDIDSPLSTVSAGGTHHGLVTPFLTEHANASNPRVFPADEPLRTQCANVKGGHFALVAPVLANTRNGERTGQAPRVRRIQDPAPTVTAHGSQGALVAAFIASHFGGEIGTDARAPLRTVTARDHNGLVTAQLGLPFGERVDHTEDVRAFLIKFYGNEREAHDLQLPLGTVTTKDRFGLVYVEGKPYRIVDIGMRMLAPRELFNAQGFPSSYVIDPIVNGRPLTKTAQVRAVGNSVCPPIAAAIVRANIADRAATEAA